MEAQTANYRMHKEWVEAELAKRLNAAEHALRNTLDLAADPAIDPELHKRLSRVWATVRNLATEVQNV